MSNKAETSRSPWLLLFRQAFSNEGQTTHALKLPRGWIVKHESWLDGALSMSMVYVGQALTEQELYDFIDAQRES